MHREHGLSLLCLFLEPHKQRLGRLEGCTQLLGCRYWKASSLSYLGLRLRQLEGWALMVLSVGEPTHSLFRYLGFLAIWHPKDAERKLQSLLRRSFASPRRHFCLGCCSVKSAPIQKQVRRCHFTVGGLLQSSY